MLVRKGFDGLFQRGWDRASGVCILRNTKTVFHECRGSTEIPYDQNSLQLIASCTKVAESVAIAWLVDRGHLRYDQKIADVWPEFTKKNKGHVTVRQLMMHRAGLCSPSSPFTDKQMLDNNWEANLKTFLEEQPLNWEVPVDDGPLKEEPQAYHAITRGQYANTICQLVDPKHRTLGQLFQQEIAGPLGIELYIGLPESLDARFVPSQNDNPHLLSYCLTGKTESIPKDVTIPDPDDARYLVEAYEKKFFAELFNPTSLTHLAMNCLAFSGVPPATLAGAPKLRRVELPSSNGVSNCLSMATLGSFLAGCFQDQQAAPIFLTPRQTLLKMTEVAPSYSDDKIMGTRVVFTQGGLGAFEHTIPGTSKKVTGYGWGGAGGQMIRFFPELEGLTIGYSTAVNGFRMAMNDPRPLSLLEAALAQEFGPH